MPSIRVVNLKKYFGKVKAVDGVSFEVKDGEFVALLGPSGCGKTTTLLMLAGIYKPTSGEIYFDDVLVNDIPPKYREVGMVFQNYALYPHMTVFENIAFPLRARRISKDEVEKRVVEIARKLLIDNLLDRKPTQLSGGQQQRVALARALVKQPKVLLFDEPLSNLDANLRMIMRAEIKHLQQELGITSVYVTHDQAEAMTMASRIAVFNQGKLVQYGTPDEVYDSPKNMFVASFIGNPPTNFLRDFSVSVENKQTILKRDDVIIKLPEPVDVKLKEVVVGIRPEHCRISRERVENSIPGVVYVVEPLGRDIIVNVKTEKGEIIKVFGDTGKAPQPGENVFLVPDLRKIHLFNPETEETIL
ncbi:sugar ABC transporter ATP-binding protein [Thermotoga maritima MSB8]|uniref:Sugar ABC transporter, ATP-binding protein n=1 Tax=Thermotoga maritima (strain ATCC 43589 / DSM 3109 / JCM 10099 / NBRC 100826 / MSB8) TaxID=243274 RepID=Q9WYQ2_THEMA|nr:MULTISPECIES: ABC transporter ATP-binding protein [Thermotoga]2YYZ_A Chain A, Sugar ABC transporter, ATP-binding protein [Thermotoga maritima MSB8]AAD35506.1 sugar ABC transporter, ATP-binding protein [Thermotoga maritima MSB8]AGL49343.1 myo-inositol ABC transporter, ATP-binding protein InoL [Thermotoga maritima MSB8]AHD17821.1 sugar ABC transporter ATP-binding protein [Thermotoga maritima MSB8]AIY86074.1 sugar ABC transporter ATP-binding protein [Thermotoga sp. 2812B]AKE26351.1 sugar ABC 